MGKFLLTLLILLVIIFSGQFIFSKFIPDNAVFGVTFSQKYATELNLDWKKVYLSILDDLKVKNLRIPTYWDREDLSEVDFMLDEAKKRQAKVILTLGIKQPRWPECHIPKDIRALPVLERQEKALEYIKKVVERYKEHSEIVYFQVENEPTLDFFGDNCDKFDAEFLKKEVELVRSLSEKPLILTDSGELGGWDITMKLSDVFGISVYRKVYNPTLGYASYPLLPYFYPLKAKLIGNKKTIIAELQAEPWFYNNFAVGTEAKAQIKLFSPEELKSNVAFARQTGFSDIYLWGVEWWYFMKEKGHPEYWDFAKSLFQ